MHNTQSTIKRICFVAGDPSGDTHAAHLIEALKRKDPSLSFSGLGGPAMEKAGMDLIQDLTKSAAIGPLDALKHLSELLEARKQLKSHLQKDKPSRLVLVDFGDYNLPFIAPIAHEMGIPITYFICPQMWAWGSWRVKYIKRYVESLLVLFKFEESFYSKQAIPASWIGHPLLDQAAPTMSPEEARKKIEINPWRMTVGLLPGSRKKEISRNLPVMLRAAERVYREMPGIQFVLPKAGGIEIDSLIEKIEPTPLDITVVDGNIYNALQTMDAAVVASGTATLEAALLQIPMVVVYRLNPLIHCIAKPLIKTKHIGLVNIVAGKRVVPELIQYEATPKRIAQEITDLLRNTDKRASMIGELKTIRETLGEPGAVERAADILIGQLADSGVS